MISRYNPAAKPARRGLITALAIVVMIAACSNIPPSGRTTSGSTSSTPTTSSTKRPDTKRPVTINAECSWKDENGYNGKMKLLAAQSEVQAFVASVNDPKHGTCHFTLADFRQTQKTPNVELKGKASPCTVRMWTQGKQVAVAFSSCKSMCTGDVVDYLWPILANSATGSCG